MNVPIAQWENTGGEAESHVGFEVHRTHLIVSLDRVAVHGRMTIERIEFTQKNIQRPSEQMNLVEVEREVNRVLVMSSLGITKFLAKSHQPVECCDHYLFFPPCLTFPRDIKVIHKFYTYLGLQICKILNQKSRAKLRKNKKNAIFYPQQLSKYQVINISTKFYARVRNTPNFVSLLHTNWL